jgi:hypothetical protein
MLEIEEDEPEPPSFEVVFVSAERTLVEVEVEAKTGAVLEVEREGEGSGRCQRCEVARARALVSALQSCPDMRTVAVVAGVSLLVSGCSAIVRRPAAASTVADISFLVGAAVMTPHVLCEATEDHCMDTNIVATTFGVPILLVGAVAGMVALSNDAQQRKADAAAKTAD